MPCGAEKCRCVAFQPSKWAPTKCHLCFHWDHQHDALDVAAGKELATKEIVQGPPVGELPTKSSSGSLYSKYSGLSACSAASQSCSSFSSLPRQSPSSAIVSVQVTKSSNKQPQHSTKDSFFSSPKPSLPPSASFLVNKDIKTANSTLVMDVSNNSNSNSQSNSQSSVISARTSLYPVKGTREASKSEAVPARFGTNTVTTVSMIKDLNRSTPGTTATASLSQAPLASSPSSSTIRHTISALSAPSATSHTSTIKKDLPPPPPSARSTIIDPPPSTRPTIIGPPPFARPTIIGPPPPLEDDEEEFPPLPPEEYFDDTMSSPPILPAFNGSFVPIGEGGGAGRTRNHFHVSPPLLPASVLLKHANSAESNHRREQSEDNSNNRNTNNRLGVPDSNNSNNTHSSPHYANRQRLVTVDFVDDSDDDVDYSFKTREVRQETIASLSSKVSKPFVVVKGNKYGVKQSRVIAVDDRAMTLKFCDMTLRLKSEVPVSHLTLAISEDNDRKLSLSFKQRARVYDIWFESAADCVAFAANIEIAFKAQMELQRKEDAVITNALISGESQEIIPLNKYQEYRVLKKNKYRHKQVRILVLKPKSLALLDADRKFIKAFDYELIYSVETNATEEDKKGAAYEAETFLVFHQTAGQRPFQVFFPDPFDRQLFSQTLRSLHRKLVIKDGDNPSSARFSVTKTNTTTANKGTHRILEILGSELILRSYDRVKQFKDTAFSAVRSIEACSIDNKRVFFEVQRKRGVKTVIYDFSDTLTRARFLSMASFALDCERTIPPGLKLSIFCGTWNVGGSSPSEEFFFLDQFIKSDSYDIYAIGMQECPQGKRDEWVVEFQRHCGGHSREFAALGPAERKAQTKYDIVASTKLWEISVLILVRTELVYKVTGVTELSVACGVAGALGNKGAAAAFLRYEDTSLGFVVCHLAARAERLKERRQDFLKIVKGIRLADKELDIVNSCDHLFWFGDLNYRVDKGFHETIAAVEAKQFDELASCDQLKREMNKGPKDLVFPGFQEGRLSFAPTYRWEKARNVFSNKREQAPSYTDRILWHTLQQESITLDTYGSAPDILGSDHRPCYAGFTLSPRSFLWGGRENTLEIIMKPLRLEAEEPDVSCLRLVVTAPFLRESETLPQITREAGALRWQWTEGLHVRAYLEKDHVAQQHLLVCAQAAYTHECLGYATIPLVMNESRFRSQLTKDGILLGYLNGFLSVSVTPEDTVAESRIPRRRPEAVLVE